MPHLTRWGVCGSDSAQPPDDPGTPDPRAATPPTARRTLHSGSGSVMKAGQPRVRLRLRDVALGDGFAHVQMGPLTMILAYV